MPNIDERVVQMSFDNAQFEAGVSKSMNTLEKLKSALNFDGAAQSFEKLEESSKDLNFSHLSSSVDKIAEKFTLLGQIGLKAMDKIATSVVNAGEKMVKGISIDQVSRGFSKYETRTKAVQTIMAATGKSVEEVEEVLNDLMDYTDMTSYDFSEMAASIGKFTSVGVDLKVAEKAMEGIANEAALSGAGIQEANRAMYNFAQALSAGSVRLIDWKSIENANMATKEFKEELIKTAIAMGTLNTENGQTGVIMKQTKKATKKAAAEFRKTEVDYQSFNQTLSEGWLTSEVLIETLNRYGDTTNDLGDRAYKAAKVALTFTQAIDAVKDAVSSGWMKSFNLMFGNVEEAGKLWTDFCDAIIEVVGQIGEYRNAVLEVWHNGSEESGISGYISMIEAAKNIWETFTNVLDAAKDAIANVIPPATGEDLIAITEKIRIASENLAKFLHYDQGVTVKEEIAVTKNLLEDLNPKNLKLGQVSDDAKQLNKALTEMGYLGEVTVSAFEAISQDRANLTPGAFDVIDADSSVEKIKTLQEALIKAGVVTDEFVADGVYGPKTKEALIKLQKEVGVEQTGIWDRATAYAASNDNRYHIKAMSDKYTTATEAAVKKFQKQFGLEETGIWDDATQKVAEASGAFEKAQKKNLVKGLDSDLKTGDATKGVKKLQKALVEAGIATEDLVADGIYGPKTEAAVKKLQRELKVAETGVWDETTREAAKTYDKFNKIETTMGEVVKHAGEQYKVTKYLEHTIDHAEELNFTAKVGVKSTDVAKLQEQLQNAGYSVGAAGADGIYGPQTKAAIEKLQADLDVNVTGAWDKATREAAIREGVFTEVKGEMVEVTETVEGSSNAILNFQNIVSAGASILSFFGKVIGIVVGVGKHLAELFAPLGGAIFNVIGLIAGLITNTEQEAEASGVFENILNSINTALDFLAPIINTVADAINGFVDSVYEADVYTLGDFFAFLGEKIKTAFKELREKYPILDTIVSLFEWARDSVLGFLTNLTGWDGKLSLFENIGKIFTNVKKTIDKNIKQIKKKLKPNIFGKGINKVLGAIAIIGASIQQVWDPKKSFGENIKNSFKAIGYWIEQFRKDFPALDFILNIKDKVVDLYKTIKGYTFNDEGKFVLFDNIKAKVEEIKQSIGDFFTGLREKYPIVDTILKAFEWIQEKFDGIVSSLSWDNKKSFKENIITNVNIIKDKVGEALGELKDKFDNFVENTPILKFLSGIFDSIKGFAFDDEGNFVFFDNVKAKIEEIRTSIDNFFSDLRGKYPVIDQIFKAFEWVKEKIDGIKAALSWDPEKTFGENIGAAFDTIKDKVKEAFDEIKAKIDEFLAEHPGLLKAVEMFNLIKDSIVGFFTVDTSGEEGVGGKLQKRLEKLQPLFDGILEFVQSDTFRNIAIAIGSALLLGLVVSLTGIGPILWDALKNGVASLAQNNPLIGSFATTVFNPFARFMEGLFGDLFKGTESFGWDSEKSFGENIQNNFQILQDNIATILANIRAKIEEFINSPQVQGFISKIRPIIDFLVLAFNKIREAVSSFITADTSGTDNPFEKLKIRLKEAAGPLIEMLQKVKDKILGLWNSLFGTGEDSGGDSSKPKIVERLREVLEKLKKTKWINKGFALAGIILLTSIGWLIAKVGSAVASIAEGYRIAKGGSKRKHDTIGDTLLKIAGAVAIISIALLAMTIPDPERLKNAFDVFKEALGLVAAFAVVSNFFHFGSELKGIGSGLLQLALSVAVIIGAIALLTYLITKVQQDNQLAGAAFLGVVGVIAILGILTIFAYAISKFAPNLKNGGKGINPVLQLCLGVLVLSAAVAILATTIDVYDPKTFWIAMGALGAMIVLLGGFMLLAGLVTKNTGGKLKISGFLKMCLGVLVLSWAIGNVCKAVANENLPADKLLTGLGALGGAIFLVGLVAILLALANKSSKGPTGSMKQGGGGASFLAVAVGVLLLSQAITNVINAIDSVKNPDSISTALMALATGVVVVALVAGLLGSLGSSGMGIAGLIVGAGAFVAIAWSISDLAKDLAAAIKSVKDVDPEVIKNFLFGIAACIGAMAVAGLIFGLLGPVGDLLSTVAIGAITSILSSFMSDMVGIMTNLGMGLGRFNKHTADIDIEKLEKICDALKDHLIPMFVKFAKTSFSKDKLSEWVSALRGLGQALGAFWRKVQGLTENIGNVTKLTVIPTVIASICAIMDTISNTEDARLKIQQVGASLSLFDVYTRDIEFGPERGEAFKAIAQSAYDVGVIALKIGDTTEITNNLVMVGASLREYAVLTAELTLPSEDDIGMQLAQQAKDVSDKILEIGDSTTIVDKLVSIGAALSLYSSLMRGVSVPAGEDAELKLEGISDEDIGMKLATSVVGIYESLKDISGDELDAINSNIVLLGGALKLYYQALGEIDTVNAEGEEIEVDPKTVSKVLDTIIQALPDSETFKSAFEQVKSLVPETEEGVDNLALFSAGMVALGTAIGGFADNIGKFSGKEAEIEAANGILELAKGIWTNFEDGSDVLPDDKVIKNGASFDPATEGKRDLTNFSAGIEALGGAIGDYATNLSSLTGKEQEVSDANSIIETAASIWSTFSEESNIPSEEAVDNGAMFDPKNGTRNLSNFSAGIVALGGAIGDYAEEIGKLKGKKTEVLSANSIINTAARIWTLFATDGTVPEKEDLDGVAELRKEGSNNLSGFVAGIEELGGAIGSYVQNISGIKTEDITAANMVIEQVESIWTTVRDNTPGDWVSQAIENFTGNLKSVLGLTKEEIDPETGEKIKTGGLYDFANEMEDLGEAIKYYVEQIEGINLKEEDITKAKDMIDFMAKINNDLKPSSGFLGWIIGRTGTELTNFSLGIEAMGDGVANFFKAITGFGEEDFEGIPKDFEVPPAIKTIITDIQELNNALPDTGGLAGKLLGDQSLTEFGSSLKTVGQGIYNFWDETKGISPDTELSAGVAAIVGIVKDLAEASSILVNSPTVGDVVDKVNTLINGVINGNGTGDTGGLDYSPFQVVGENIAANIASGMDTTDADINPADVFKALLDRAKLRGELHAKGSGWFKIGYYICKGLSDGIANYAYIPKDSAVEMMNQLKQAAADAVGEASPSKDFMKIGEYIDDGLIIGLQKYSDGVTGAGGELTEGALTAAKGGLNAISNLLSDDIDANPTIRPVLDLSEIRAQAGTLNGYFGSRTMGLRVATPTVTANRISASEQRNSAARNSSDNGLATAVTNLDEKVEALGNKLSSLRVVMNSGALVGQIANDMDRELGRRTWRARRMN